MEDVLRLVQLERRRGQQFDKSTDRLGMRQRPRQASRGSIPATCAGPRRRFTKPATAGLDPLGHPLVTRLPARGGKAEEGRTVLVSSHVLAEMAQTVDEVVDGAARQAGRRGLPRPATQGRAPAGRAPTPSLVERLRTAPAARAGCAAGADSSAEGGAGWPSRRRGGRSEDARATAAENGIPAFELYRLRQSPSQSSPELTRGHLQGGPSYGNAVLGPGFSELRTTRTFWTL